MSTITDYHAKYYAHDLTLKNVRGVGRLSRALFDAQVDLNPHQIEAALFALNSPLSKGVILADEVGLGKTIEAGIILCQLWAERKRRILIIGPAAIRKQWALEMEEKFNLPAVVLDAKATDSFNALAIHVHLIRNKWWSYPIISRTVTRRRFEVFPGIWW